MVPGGVTEIIWHFAGYFHRIDDVLKERFVYEDGGAKWRPDDYVAELKDYLAKADIDDFTTHRSPYPLPLFEESARAGGLHGPGLRPMHAIEETEFDEGGPARPPVGPRLAPVDGPGKIEITVSYRDGGAQQLLDIDQANAMADDDLLLVLPDSGAANLHDLDIDATLDGMAEGAQAHVPDSLALPLTGTAAAADFLAAYDASLVEQGGDPSGHSVAPGRYVNGELSPEPEADAGLSTEPIPQPDGEASETAPALDPASKGQWAMLGANEATNAALIIDLKEGTNTMIVLGDFFKTNAIVQSNSYIDNDQVEIAGGLAQAITGGGNTAENIADIQQKAGPFAGLETMFAGLHWNVDVVNGDFYDINLVYQTNILRDNDVAVQETQQTHYEAHLGENEQLNLTQLISGEIRYDLIVVEGDFHAANWIFQKNILLDSDLVKIAAGGDAAHGVDQSAATGANKLLNAATIVTYGDDTFDTPDEAMTDLVTALGDGAPTLGLANGWLIPGNGSGVLNVLYVKGDYYDINAIWQTNIIADVDTAIQLFGAKPPEEIAGDGTLTQSAATGGNLLINEAIIVDVGATSSFVGGGVYQDTILIQGDLVAQDSDSTVVYGDPLALVTELIAFTGDDALPQDDVTDAKTPIVPDDTMGSILT